MREIFLPIILNSETSIEFSKSLSKLDLDDKELIIINITNFAKSTGRIEPFGSLMAINSIRNLYRKCSIKGVPIKTRYTKEYAIKNNYAKSLRFYSSLGLDIGESPDNDYKVSDSANFIPIIKSDFREISKAVHEQDEINLISKRIAKVVSKKNQNLYNYFNFSINEILRNVIEHSGKREIWYCAQYWPSTIGGRFVEVSIMDEGIGIHNSLIEELGEDEKNILKFSLVPGCSSKPTTHYIDSAINSGFGLYMTSEIGRQNGDFILASNTEVLRATGAMEHSSECFITGTIITLRLYIDNLQEYKLKNQELVNKGLEKSKAYLKYRERKKFAPGLELNSFFK